MVINSKQRAPDINQQLLQSARLLVATCIGLRDGNVTAVGDTAVLETEQAVHHALSSSSQHISRLWLQPREAATLQQLLAVALRRAVCATADTQPHLYAGIADKLLEALPWPLPPSFVDAIIRSGTLQSCSRLLAAGAPWQSTEATEPGQITDKKHSTRMRVEQLPQSGQRAVEVQGAILPHVPALLCGLFASVIETEERPSGSREGDASHGRSRGGSVDAGRSGATGSSSAGNAAASDDDDGGEDSMMRQAGELFRALRESHVLEHTAKWLAWEGWPAAMHAALHIAFVDLLTCVLEPFSSASRCACVLAAPQLGLQGPCLQYLLTAAAVEALALTDGGPRYGLPQDATTAAIRRLVVGPGGGGAGGAGAAASGGTGNGGSGGSTERIALLVLHAWTSVLVNVQQVGARPIIGPRAVYRLALRVSRASTGAARSWGEGHHRRGGRSRTATREMPISQGTCALMAMSAVVAAHRAIETHARDAQAAQQSTATTSAAPAPCNSAALLVPSAEPSPAEPVAAGVGAATAARREEATAAASEAASEPAAAGREGVAEAAALVRPAGWWRASAEALAAAAEADPGDEDEALVLCSGTSWLLELQLNGGQLDLPLPDLLPADPPPDVARALSAGLVPCLERLLRRKLTPLVCSGYWSPLSACLFRWRSLAWLLAYAPPREGSALVATLGKALWLHVDCVLSSARTWGPKSKEALEADKQAVETMRCARRALLDGLDWVAGQEAAAATRGAADGAGDAVVGAAAAADSGSARECWGEGRGGQLRRLLAFSVLQWLPVLLFWCRSWFWRDLQCVASDSGVARGAPELCRDTLRLLGCVADWVETCDGGGGGSGAASGVAAGGAERPVGRSGAAAGAHGPQGSRGGPAADESWAAVWRMLSLENFGLYALAGVAEVAVAHGLSAEEVSPLRRVLRGLVAHFPGDLRESLCKDLPVLFGFERLFGEGGALPDFELLDALLQVACVAAPPRVRLEPVQTPRDAAAPRLPPLSEVASLLRVCHSPSCLEMHYESEACLEPKLSACRGCRRLWFCSRECEKEHRKAYCKGSGEAVAAAGKGRVGAGQKGSARKRGG